MSRQGKPRCGSCGGSRPGITSGATPIDTTMRPSSCETVTGSCSCTTPTAPDCQPCEENHTQTIRRTAFGYTLKVRNSFNWPADGEDVELQVKDVTSVIPGQLLQNETVGSLYVQSFDFENQIIVARNRGDSCNTKAAGDIVPSCTEFAIGPVQCVQGGTTPGSGIPYLAADFIAPGNGECAIAKVTTIVGLSLGAIVSILSYQYTVQTIIDNETIELCDTGDGAPEGTVIKADPDCNGTLDVPIIVISTANPCSQDPITSGGVVIGCVDGQPRQLTGTIDGQILIWNQDAGKWEPRAVNIPEAACTTLTSELALDPDHVGSYLVTVADSSIFEADDSVQIEGSPDGDVFTVNDVVDATHIHVTPDFEVTVIHEYESGEVICLADCCVDIQKQIDALAFAGNAHQLNTGTGSSGPANDDPFTTADMSFTITNPSATRAMRVHLILKFLVNGTSGAALGDLSSTRFALVYTINGGGANTIFIENTVATETDGGVALINSVEVIEDTFQAIGPGLAQNYVVHGVVTKITTGAAGAGEDDGEYNVLASLLTASYIGIPG